MILLFNDWVLSKPQGGLLGYQYDNLTRELVVQGDLPQGWTWDVLVSASGNSDTWPLALGDGQASITLTDDNLSVRGEYYLQLRGTNGDQVRHTNVITAYNSRSLSGAGQWPTLPTEWIQAEKDIKELNAHPPVPGSNGYWLLWDLSSHSYQESDLPVPVGPAGPPNVLEIGTVETLPADQPATASITGESPAQKLNLGIPQGKQGATGNPGAPGKDGVQLNDSAINTTEAWSSKKIVDTLCPSFSVSGNPVTCNPVEDYPLSAVVTLEPKQAGSGDPSPENVRPISGYDEVAVNVRGKNVVNVDDIPVANVSSSGTYYTSILPFKPYLGVTFTLSANVRCLTESYTGNWQLNLGCGNANYARDITNINDWGAEQGARISVTGTCDEQDAKYQNLAFRVRMQTATPGVTFEITNIMLEVNDTPTPYEPYQPGTTAALTLPETIYGGTVDAVTGVGSEEWAFVEFDGTENWEVSSAEDGKYFYLLNTNPPLAESNAGLCSCFLVGMVSYISADLTIQLPYTEVRLWRVKYDTAATAEDFKSYLATQAAAGSPVQVAYKLATPEPFQATGNQALPAVAGLNTLYTDGDSLTVTGRRDLVSALEDLQTTMTAVTTLISEGGLT